MSTEHQVVVLMGALRFGKPDHACDASTCSRTSTTAHILLHGRDISDPRIDADEARQAMGMVFQSFNLFPTRPR